MASDIRKQISAAAENSRNGQVFVDHAGKRHWNTTGGVLMEKILYDLMDWAGNLSIPRRAIRDGF